MTTLTTGRSNNRPPDLSGRTFGRGFTLLELILVMLLVAMAAAISRPALAGFRASRELSWSAGQLGALAERARSSAGASGSPWRLNLEAAEGACWLTFHDGNGWTRPDNGPVFGFTLPRGVEIEFLRPPAARERTANPGLAMPWDPGTPGEDAEPGVHHITFYPDGRADPSALRLSGRRESVVEMVIRSPAAPLVTEPVPGDWERSGT